MSPSPHPSALDPVLAHAPYVRALARELVFDAHLARDAEQEILLAALEHGPRDPGALRAWLAVLVRNFAIKAWRSSSRRARRERDSARREASVPSPAEILEREDQRRHLVEHVLALDEPLRAVLILRFLEELPPRAVARRLALPVETVRSRTRRGLEVLRERLDRESRGKREAWCVAFVRGFQLPASLTQLGAAFVSSSSIGVAVVMSLANKIALPALAVLVLATGLALRSRGGRAEGGGGRPALPAEVVGADGAAPRVSAPVLEALAAVASQSREALAAPVPSPAEHLEALGAVLLRMSWHDGTPAADVSAAVHSHAAEDFYADAFEVRTGADGTCRIDGLPPGRISVYGRADAAGSAVVVAGEELELALTIPLGFDVDGIVVDASGGPVNGAEIVADDSGMGWTGALVARSGADGRFHVRSIAEGLCWLWAREPGFAPAARYVLTTGAGATLEVQLTLPAPGGSLVGSVRDAAGQGIAHAQLLVGEENTLRRATVPEGGRAVVPSARRVIADENGRFEVSGLATGPQAVRVRAKDFAPWIGEAEVSEVASTQLGITLFQEVSVEGAVTDASGAPVAGAEVSTAGVGSFLDRVTRSRADGSFFLRGLPCGEFEVRVEVERRGSQRTALIGTPGALLRWDPVLDGGLSLRGRIVAPGIDPTECVVHCERFVEGEAGYRDGVHPDEQGVFEFTGLAGAGHRIEVLASGSYFFPLAVREDLHPGPEEVVIELDAARWPSVRLKGRVLDARGEPVAGAALHPRLATHSGASPSLTTDVAGAFDLGPYPPGRWTVVVLPGTDRELRSATVDVAPDAIEDFGDLRLGP